MIFKGSRYEQLAKQANVVTDDAGQSHALLPIRFLPSTPATYRHTMSANERLDLLAYHFYSNPEKFWLIADANPQMDPDDLLQVGLSVLIPPDRNR